MSRLLLPKRLLGPQTERISIWHIFSPHFRSHSGRNIPSDELLSGRVEPSRLAALSLDPSQTTGISFFLFRHMIDTIHGHSKQGSQALLAFQKMSQSSGLPIHWIYVPIAANDKVISISTVRTKSRPTKHLVSARAWPITISYSIVVRSPP
jgi:hypothetical protein